MATRLPKPEWATLDDSLGSWCAWCMRYFQPGGAVRRLSVFDKEEHHVYQKARARPLPNDAKRILSWCVPVCAVPCHRQAIQVYADFAASQLEKLANVNSVRDLKTAADGAFRVGNINLALWLYGRAAERSDSPEEKAVHLETRLATAAGSGLRRALWQEFVMDHPWACGDDASSCRNPWTINYAANILGALGDFRRARLFSQQVTERTHPKRHGQFQNIYESGSVMRRETAIDFNPPTAREALILATKFRERYAIRTSQIMQGWSFIRERQYREARDCFDKVLEPQPVSWWHRAEAYRGSGVARYLEDKRNNTETACGYLQRAQYISAMLGIAPFTAVNAWAAPLSVEAHILPSTILNRIIAEQPGKLNKTRLEELRTEYIIENNTRTELVDTLTKAC